MSAPDRAVAGPGAGAAAAPGPAAPAPSGGGPSALRYAVGAFATGTFGTVPGLLLLYYLTDTLAVPAAVASVVVFLPKAWDVFLNPWVGRRSDRTRGRFGPRLPWMAGGGVALSAGFVLLFAAPTPKGLPSAVWVGVAFFCCASAYAAFQVPYTAVLAELADDPAIRTRLATWRTVFYGTAILLAGGAAPLLVHAAGSERVGYALMGGVLGLVLLTGTLAAASNAPRGTGARPRPTAMTFRQQAAVARASRPFRRLLGVHLAQTLATGIMLGSAQYFATYRLHDSKATTALFGCLILPLLLTAPVWHAAGRRLGPGRGLLSAICLFVAGSSLLLATPVVPRLLVYGCVAVCGVGYAGMQTFAVAMLSDVIAEDAREQGEGHSRGGAFTGLWTAAEVIGAGAGPALFSGLLAVTGFVSSSAEHRAAQPGAALTAILLGVSLLPALVLLPAAVCAARLARDRGARTGH